MQKDPELDRFEDETIPENELGNGTKTTILEKGRFSVVSQFCSLFLTYCILCCILCLDKYGNCFFLKVKKTEIKDRMIEIDSFKYCEQNGISTQLQPHETYAEKVPPEALDKFSKKWAKPKNDMSKVRIFSAKRFSITACGSDRTSVCMLPLSHNRCDN